MDDSPQILDVSYGNFSCRLEGFDDSVGTMKAVVSYFHELAGHNRFMDMAPQAPDMETLERLAEEQAGTPVTVEVDGNAVGLRAAFADVDDTIEDEADDAIEDEADDAIAEDAMDEAAAELAEADQDDEVVAEETEDDVAEDVVAADLSDEIDEMDDIAAFEASEDDLEQDDSDTVEEDAAFTDEVAEDAEAYDDSEDDIDPADDSVAAKLQRIRAVVTKEEVSNAEAPTEEAYAEDITAPEEPVISGNPLAQRLADLAKRNAERAAEEASIDLDDDEDDAISAEEMAALEAEFAEEEASETDGSPETAREKSTLLELAPEDRASDYDLTDFAKAMREDDIDTSDRDSGPLVLTPDAEISSDEDDDDFDLKNEVAEAQRSIEALGKGSKGSDVLNNVNMNTTRILSQADEHLNEPEGRRHRDAFAQLKAAVAATEAARQLGDPGASRPEQDEAFREDFGAHAAEEKNENATRRLSRESRILKAEAASAKAARRSEDSEKSDDAADARRAETSQAPAPLKLVSSKTVEPAGKAVDAASARLREIASQKTTGGSSKGGFAEFADQKGATELADLLEAAAAYIAFVEGDDDFSRPQVMKKVQSATKTAFSREDGLRSFGRLLRQSRIIKLQNGRFQVSEDTRFRPENKAAQG